MKCRRCSWPTNERKHATYARCITTKRTTPWTATMALRRPLCSHPPTPEEILEDKQLRDQLYAAVMELPDKQAKWIYARFYLGMTVKEIAQAEDVDLSWVYKSIKRGLKCLGKNFKNLN